MNVLRRRLIITLCIVIPALFICVIAYRNTVYGAWRVFDAPFLPRLEFKLGTDLVGGTVLIYEIDETREKKENFSMDQLVTSLKRRIDPSDLYGIQIRPLGQTRVEITIPTGSRFKRQEAEKRWAELIEAIEKEWPGTAGKNLGDIRVGGEVELGIAIRQAEPSAKDDDIRAFIAKHFDADLLRGASTEKVEEIKQKIQSVGSLEFRILANKSDDRKAIEAAKEPLEKAARSWHEYLDNVGRKWPALNQPTDKDPRKLADLPPGDLTGLKELFAERAKGQEAEYAAFARSEFQPSDELRDLMKRAEIGLPPPPPQGADGQIFKDVQLNDGTYKFSYSWVEIGKSELDSLHLTNENRTSEQYAHIWKAAEAARKALKPASPDQKSIVLFEPVLVNPSNADYGTVPPGGERWGTVIFSRRIPNKGRLLPKDRDKEYEYFFLTRNSLPGKAVTGEYLVSAKEGAGKTGEMSVDFRFNPKGGNLFRELTRANKPPSEGGGSRRYLAIALDGYIISAPGLNDEIGDSGQISGKFTKADIDLLVNFLRSGALPATLKAQPVSENTIGATLGDDTIRSGTLSIAIAFIAVLAFMLLYYRFAGLVACIALLINLFLTIAFMVLVGATFTLPGLAGLVLTLAMAVDANVLIYERLREERERGASLPQAIRNGYDRAFATIIDTHLTSILTAIVLYIVGTAELRGFGISLTVGLIISLFTALYVTRIMFDFWTLKGWLKKLSMVKLLSKTNINFMGIRKPVLIATTVLTVLGLVVFLARGRSGLAIDFVGGTADTVQLKEFMSLKDVRKLLEDHDRQKERLALAANPTMLRPNIWELTYKDKGDKELKREIFVAETDITPEALRVRAEALPDVSIRPEFSSSPELTNDAGESKLFTIQTTEKIKDLAAAQIDRLLSGEDLKKDHKIEPEDDGEITLLKKTRLTGYRINQFVVTFPAGKLATEPQTRALLEAELKKEGLIKAGAGLTLVGEEGDSIKKEYRTWKVQIGANDGVDGAKLGTALARLTATPAAGAPPLDRFDFNEAILDLSEAAYLAQVQLLANQQFQEILQQPVALKEAPKAGQEKADKKEDNKYASMRMTLPTPLEGRRFSEAMARFTTELRSRPLPIQLVNIDSPLAADMQRRALVAIVASWGAILLYVWFRFGNWTFGLAAVLCLVHDLCFTIGIIGFTHYIYDSFIGPPLLLEDFKIDLACIAALLTLIGFSVNDTIVVFDRIREVRGKNPHLTPEMINDSVNQTLSRTVLTSLIAFLVVIVLYIWGGAGVHLFAFVMVVGVIVGTFSSIFVASPLLLILGEGAPKEGATQRQPERVATE